MPACPEDRQWRGLRADQGQLDVLGTRGADDGRGHEGQLVERQWPERPRRHHEGDGAGVPRAQAVQQAGEPALAPIGSEGDRRGVGGAWPSTGREHQRVVARFAVLERHGVPAGSTLSRRSWRVWTSCGTTAATAWRRTWLDAEGGAGRERLDDDLRVRSDELQADAVAGQVVQGEDGLQAGDAATDHDDVEWRSRSHRPEACQQRAGLATASARPRLREIPHPPAVVSPDGGPAAWQEDRDTHLHEEPRMSTMHTAEPCSRLRPGR
jgi:hypothetical protein